MQINEISQGASLGAIGAALGKGFVQAATPYRFDPNDTENSIAIEDRFLKDLGKISYRAFLDNRVENRMLTPLSYRFTTNPDSGRPFTDQEVSRDAKSFAIQYFGGTTWGSLLGDQQKAKLLQFINQLPEENWMNLNSIRNTFYIIANYYKPLFYETKSQPLLNAQQIIDLANSINELEKQLPGSKNTVMNQLRLIILQTRNFALYRRTRF